MSNTNEIETTETVTSDNILAGFNFESPSLRVARVALEKTQARVTQLQEIVTKESEIEKTAKITAEKLVKNLRRSKLSDEAILAALHKQFGQKRNATTTERQNHSVSDDDQIAILEFISGNPGCNKLALREKFTNVDYQGLNIVVKNAINDGKVRREGNTRKAVYYIV